MAERTRDIHRAGWTWRDCQEDRIGLIACRQKEAPAQPRVGQEWFDERSRCLSIWSGTEWVAVPAD
jgi:hypothetical protein